MSQIIPLFKRIASKENANKSGEGRLEKFFKFVIGKKEYVVPAVDVAEVAAYSSLIDIPTNSEIISGVVNVRGTVIPIINVRKRLDLSSDYIIGEKSKIIYFKAKQDFFIGMIVDDIDFRLKEGIIMPNSKVDNYGKKIILMEEKNTDHKEYEVFFIDNILDSEEFEIVRKVLDSF